MALQAVVFACGRAPAHPVDLPVVRGTADAAVESVDARDAAWVKRLCEGGEADAIVAEAAPELVEDCYPKPRASCAPRVRIHLATCASFARDVVLVSETLDGHALERSWEYPAMGIGPDGTTLSIPAMELGVHGYRIVAKAEGHPNGTAVATVSVRDPALERARREYCTDLSGAGIFDAGRAPPARDGIELRVQHTACYGSCPAYTVTLRTDGSVIYEGSSDVRVNGVVIDLVPPAVVAILLARFDGALATPIHVNPHEHCASSADSPKTHVMLLRNGKVHGIPTMNSCEHPEERQIAVEIDRVTRSDRWVTGSRECRDRGLW